MSEPRIILPDGFRDKSGIYLPTEMGAVAANVELPPELRPRVDLIVAGRLPGFVDQVLAYATEEELGFDVMSPENIAGITQKVAFWPSLRFLSRFQRDLWHVRDNQEGQKVLLGRWFAGSEFAARAERWLAQGERRVLFSEQQLFALQRLILLNALDGPVEADLTQEECRARRGSCRSAGVALDARV